MGLGAWWEGVELRQTVEEYVYTVMAIGTGSIYECNKIGEKEYICNSKLYLKTPINIYQIVQIFV